MKMTNNTMIYYCDNKIAVNKIQYCQKRNNKNQNYTLKADYNVQSQIEHMIKIFKQSQ